MGLELPTPTLTLVTVHGTVAPGVAIDTDPVEPSPSLAVHSRAPSNAIARGAFPRLVATVVTVPAVWLGSIVKSFPGFVAPEIATRPAAITTALAPVAPVQVSRSFALLECTRETVPSRLGTQMSSPSACRFPGLLPTVVRFSTAVVVGFQN